MQSSKTKDTKTHGNDFSMGIVMFDKDFLYKMQMHLKWAIIHIRERGAGKDKSNVIHSHENGNGFSTAVFAQEPTAGVCWRLSDKKHFPVICVRWVNTDGQMTLSALFMRVIRMYK